MSYCSNCGGRLNDKGLCPNCGGISEANVKPNQKEDSDVLNCVKAFLTDSPLKGVEKAARTRSVAVWVTFSALYVVCATVLSLAAFGTMSPDFFREVCGADIASVLADSSGSSDSLILSFGGLMAHAAIMAILSLLTLTAMTEIAFIFAKEKPSVNQALNIAAFSTFPLSAIMLVAIPAALITSSFAILLLIVGITASAVAYYYGIQKASQFSRSPFLTLLGSAIVGAALLTFCSQVLAMLFFG